MHCCEGVIIRDHLAYNNTRKYPNFHCNNPIAKTTCLIRALSSDKMGGLYWKHPLHLYICFNSQDKLTKSVISRFKHCSKSPHLISRKLHLFIIGPNSNEMLTKIETSSKIAQNPSSRLQEIIPGHYWSQFI